MFTNIFPASSIPICILDDRVIIIKCDWECPIVYIFQTKFMPSGKLRKMKKIDFAQLALFGVGKNLRPIRINDQ